MPMPQPTTWRVHLAARHPGRTAAAVIAMLLGLSAVAALVPRAWGPGSMVVMLGLAALLLAGSVAEFLLPVTYTLDAEGAHARHWGSHRALVWKRVRRVYLRPDGIKLSPLLSPGFVESYRGVLLRAPDREAAWAAVRAWLEAAGAAPEVVEQG